MVTLADLLLSQDSSIEVDVSNLLRLEDLFATFNTSSDYVKKQFKRRKLDLNLNGCYLNSQKLPLDFLCRYRFPCCIQRFLL